MKFLVCPHTCGEIVRRLRAAMQHHDQWEYLPAVRAGDIEFVGARSGCIGEARRNEPGVFGDGVRPMGPASVRRPNAWQAQRTLAALAEQSAVRLRMREREFSFRGRECMGRGHRVDRGGPFRASGEALAASERCSAAVACMSRSILVGGMDGRGS
jgi:hypothetical protein